MRDNSYTHLEADMDLQSKIMKKLCPLLPLLLLLVLLETSSISASTFTVSNCSSSLYSSSSSNLQTIRDVSSALTNASGSQLFYNISSTSSSSTTYGMYQCRGDVSADFCYNCVIDSLNAAMQQSCQSYTGAHVSKEYCHVRYDSQPGLFDGTSPDMSPMLYIWKQVNDLNETFLNDVLEASLEAVGLAPTQPGLVAFTKKGSIYALAQCDFYLSESQCSTCLDLTLKAAIHTNESDQGIVYFGSCFYRYEAFSFYFAQPVSPSSSAGAIAGGVVGSILFLGLIACLLWFYYGRKKKSRALRLYDDVNPFHPSAIIYSYDELRAATEDFHPDNKLGEGGFGPVYKGILADGQEVAIKKLSIGSHQGKQEFTNEVTMITSVQHRNLIRLLGCCIEGPERLLVYEYLPKKSLDMYIFGSEDENHTNTMLDWKTRVEIIQGVARGLAYLHEESQIHIIHRDIKPGNILLDNNLTPKIADFGLARLSNNIDENHVTKTISGTIGYLSPEYAMHGQLTEKADVFSFGVVILEIVSGRRSIDYTQPQEKQRLLEWAWKCYREGGQLELLDPRLKNIAKEEEEEFARLIHVAVLCTQSLATDRPSMSKVGQLLVGKIEDLHVTNNNLFSNTTSLDHLRTIMDTTSTVPLIQQPFYTTGSASSQNFKVIPR